MVTTIVGIRPPPKFGDFRILPHPLEIYEPIMLGGIKVFGAIGVRVLLARVEDSKGPWRRQILEITFPGQFRICQLVHEAARGYGVRSIVRAGCMRTIGGNLGWLAAPGIIVVDAESVAAKYRDVVRLAWVNLAIETGRQAVLLRELVQPRRVFAPDDLFVIFVFRDDDKDMVVAR